VQNSCSWCVVFVVRGCCNLSFEFCQQSHCNYNVGARNVFREWWTYGACIVTAVSKSLCCLWLLIIKGHSVV
jgi:hypothetical protein